MSARRKVRFGLIGCGLMGREFASSVARWCHLLEHAAQPEIVAICDSARALFPWYQDHFPTIQQAVTDYRELLANPSVDAVYVAVPHHLHQSIYCDVITAGKHLLGEKPFGMDLEQNENILKAIDARPDLLVRCSSELPFYPGAQRVIQALQSASLGTILEVQVGFLHSSDINPEKPINWKRQVKTNGAYGCMGDLGMHVLHVPLRLGWQAQRVFAQLVKTVNTRPDGFGGMAACDTWDNATLHLDMRSGNCEFPMTLKTWRIAPGEMNSWYIQVLGMRGGVRFSTKYPRTLEYLRYEPGGAQAWQAEDIGYQSVFPTITGPIFEFGFSDSILQMWAAYLHELVTGQAPSFGCVTPAETLLQHRILTAALRSAETQAAIEVPSV